LTAVLGSSQVRGACRSSRGGGAVEHVHHAAVRHQRDLLAHMARSQFIHCGQHPIAQGDQ